MPEIKGTVTEDLVKQALYSGEVNKLLKAQVRKDFEAQIDTYVDEVLANLLGQQLRPVMLIMSRKPTRSQSNQTRLSPELTVP